MPDLDPIERALDYVERHLHEPISVGDMATAAGYSLYHFVRFFAQATHHTPYDYAMRRRLSEAARELLATDRPVIDVALDSGFGSPEAFARALRRGWDLSPTELRRAGWLDPRRLTAPLDRPHLEMIAAGEHPRPRKVALGPRWVLGIQTLARDGDPLVCALWDIARDAAPEQPSGGETGIVRHYPRRWTERGVLTVVGKLSQECDAPRLPLGSFALPSGPAVTWTCVARWRDKGLAYVLSTWAPRMGVNLVLRTVTELCADPSCSDGQGRVSTFQVAIAPDDTTAACSGSLIGDEGG